MVYWPSIIWTLILYPVLNMGHISSKLKIIGKPLLADFISDQYFIFLQMGFWKNELCQVCKRLTVSKYLLKNATN